MPRGSGYTSVVGARLQLTMRFEGRVQAAFCFERNLLEKYFDGLDCFLFDIMVSSGALKYRNL
jgi:hypothetical protein